MTEAGKHRTGGIPLQLALLLLVAAAFLAGIVPAGAMLERWVAGELQARLRADLALAPRLLADRNAAVAEAMMMHAKELAHAPGLAAAVAAGDREGAVRTAEGVARSFKSLPVLLTPGGQAWAGSTLPAMLVDGAARCRRPWSPTPPGCT